jgi:hypothetical protein
MNLPHKNLKKKKKKKNKQTQNRPGDRSSTSGKSQIWLQVREEKRFFGLRIQLYFG